MDLPHLPAPLRRTAANLAANRAQWVLFQWAHQFRSVDRATGLTAERIQLLALLDQAGPITAGEIAEDLRASRPAVARMLSGLEQAGLARRSANVVDGRSVLVRITPTGRRALARARTSGIRSMAARLRGRSDRDLSQLEQGLRILEEMLDD
ncbi:MAG: MarR family winged helix-turn-helix transcriptional regulator [Actinomycetota bacterium]